MDFMNMRFVTRMYLMWQRFEVFLAVMLPMFLIVESALANGTVYNGGTLDFHDMRSWVAFGRGLFFEVLTYALAKLCKLMVLRGHRKMVALPLVVAFWCVLVSAGNNVGWVLSGGNFSDLLISLGHFMPVWLFFLYKMGLGLLLPVSVFVLALVDVQHLVDEALQTSHLDNRALVIHESEMHRSAYLTSQKKQRKTIQQAYDGIAEKRAQAYVKKVESGDMSFGANDQKQIAGGAAAGLRRVNAPVGVPATAALPAQVAQAPSAHSGNTQTINVPPSSPAPVGAGQTKGVFGRIFGG